MREARTGKWIQCGKELPHPGVQDFTLEQVSESPGGLLKRQIAGPHPQSSWFSRSGLGPKNCISHKSPGSKCWSRDTWKATAIALWSYPGLVIQWLRAFPFLCPGQLLTLLGPLWPAVSVHWFVSLSRASFGLLLSACWFDRVEATSAKSKVTFSRLWHRTVVWPSSLGRYLKFSFTYTQTKHQKGEKEITSSGSQS